MRTNLLPELCVGRNFSDLENLFNNLNIIFKYVINIFILRSSSKTVKIIAVNIIFTKIASELTSLFKIHRESKLTKTSKFIS